MDNGLRSSEIDREIGWDSDDLVSSDEDSCASNSTPPTGDSGPESDNGDSFYNSCLADNTYENIQNDSNYTENSDIDNLGLTASHDSAGNSESSAINDNPVLHTEDTPTIGDGVAALDFATTAHTSSFDEAASVIRAGTSNDPPFQDYATTQGHTLRGRGLQRGGAVHRGDRSARRGRPMRRGGAQRRGMAPLRRNAMPLDDTWDQFTGLQKQFLFTRVSGFQVNIDSDKPVDFFKLFVTDEVVDLMVTETNRTANQILSARRLSRRSRLREWLPTTSQEMQKFLGLLIYMGLVPMPRISDYWSNSILYKNTVAPRVMSRNRFQVLLRFWHFSNNENPGENGRLAKVAPLLALLNRIFKVNKIAEEELAIDESMIPFRGRLIFRQFLPKKAHKYGVKLFKLCDKSAYTYHIKVYAGKGTNNTPEYLMGTSVVLELMAPFLNSGTTIYVDNYYNSVELAKILLEKNTHLVGTLRGDRVGIPRHLLFDHDLQRGEMAVAENKDGIVITRWLDKRYVTMLSTKHTVDMVVTDKKNSKGKLIAKPLVVDRYNGQKVGIDVADQLASYSTAVRKSLRWYKKVAEHILFGTCLVNAMLAWKHVHQKSCSITSFKESVCLALMELDNDDNPTPVVNKTGHHYLKESDIYIGLGKNKRRQRKVCKLCFKNATPEIRKK